MRTRGDRLQAPSRGNIGALRQEARSSVRARVVKATCTGTSQEQSGSGTNQPHLVAAVAVFVVDVAIVEMDVPGLVAKGDVGAKPTNNHLST